MVKPATDVSARSPKTPRSQTIRSTVIRSQPNPISRWWLLGLVGLGVIGGGIWGAQAWVVGRSATVLEQARQASQVPNPKVLAAAQRDLTQQIQWLQWVPPWPGFGGQAAQAQLPFLQAQAAQLDRALKLAQALKTAEAAAMDAALLVQNPPHLPARWQQARDKWQQAIAALERAPQDGPEAIALQGKLATYRDNRAAIERQLAVAVQAVEFNDRGVQELNAGRYREAIAWFQQAIAQNAKLAESHLGQGIAWMNLQEYRSALGALDRAVMANDKLVEGYLYRGQLRYELGDAVGALADLDRAIALDAQRADAYLVRGVIHFDRQQLGQARSDLQQAVAGFTQQRDFTSVSQAQSLLAQLPAAPDAEPATNNLEPVAINEPEPEPEVEIEVDVDRRRTPRTARSSRVRSVWNRVRSSIGRRGRR
jgi:tetratricopeptide (TPR) repeat protein